MNTPNQALRVYDRSYTRTSHWAVPLSSECMRRGESGLKEAWAVLKANYHLVLEALVKVECCAWLYRVEWERMAWTLPKLVPRIDSQNEEVREQLILQPCQQNNKAMCEPDSVGILSYQSMNRKHGLLSQWKHRIAYFTLIFTTRKSFIQRKLLKFHRHITRLNKWEQPRHF